MSSETDLQITPKRLGLICIDSFCPRCFWYKLQQRFKMPFDMFGGAIFKNLEQAEIAIVNELIEENQFLPKEFAPFNDLVSVVEFPRNYREFRCVHESGVTLYGEPDAIYKLGSGKLALIDFKTAHPRDGEDPLLPMYACQIVGYSYIAQFGLELGTVSKGGLFYWSCQHSDVIADPTGHYRSGHMSVSFVPQAHEVEIDYSTLDAPIEEAIRLWKSASPPERGLKCTDCKKFDALLQIEAKVPADQNLLDRRFLDMYLRDPFIAAQVQARQNRDRYARFSAWQEVIGMEDAVAFSETGMVANWD